MPPFNLYIDKEHLLHSMRDDLEFVEAVNYSSTYYVGTRVFKPLLAILLGEGAIQVADPDMEFNRLFSQLPAWGDYGTQELLVFRKR